MDLGHAAEVLWRGLQEFDDLGPQFGRREKILRIDHSGPFRRNVRDSRALASCGHRARTSSRRAASLSTGLPSSTMAKRPCSSRSESIVAPIIARLWFVLVAFYYWHKT